MQETSTDKLDLEKHSKAQLIALAQTLQIKGYSGKTKSELIALLKNKSNLQTIAEALGKMTWWQKYHNHVYQILGLFIAIAGLAATLYFEFLPAPPSQTATPKPNEGLQEVKLSLSSLMDISDEELFGGYRKQLERAREEEPYEAYLPIVGSEQQYFHKLPPTGAVAGAIGHPPARIWFFSNHQVFPSSDHSVFVEQLGRAFEFELRFYLEGKAPLLSDLGKPIEVLDQSFPPALKVIFGRREEDREKIAILYDSKNKSVSLEGRWMKRDPLHPAWVSRGTITSLDAMKNGVLLVRSRVYSDKNRTPYFLIQIDNKLDLLVGEELILQDVPDKKDYQFFRFKFPDTDNISSWNQENRTRKEQVKEHQEQIELNARKEQFRSRYCEPENFSLHWLRETPLTFETAASRCLADLVDGRVPLNATLEEGGIYGATWSWELSGEPEPVVMCQCHEF